MSAWAYAQADLFNPDAAEAALNDAVARVQEHASVAWMDQALAAVRLVAEHRYRFTSDPVWAVLARRGVPGPHEERAIGAVMRRAQREGICRPTNEVSRSVRRVCHRRPLRVWESCLVGRDTTPEDCHEEN